MATVREKILRVVKDNPGLNQNQVLAKAGLSQIGTPRIALHKLAKDGVLRIERLNGANTKVWLK